MRIIAGKYKGKLLNEFNLGTTRPTADMVREALFDKIGTEVAGKKFLDLFAGTGAVGLEAISRNAESSCFVDVEPSAVKIINKNIQLLNAENCEAFCIAFEQALILFAKQNKKYDYIFLDPPYNTEFAEKAIRIIFEKKLLNDDGLIIWEHDKTKLEYIAANFPESKTKKYGIKYLTYIYANI